MFLLAARLPSGPSACADLEAAPLFGSFISTTQASDFSPAWMSGVRARAFPNPPAANFTAGTGEISQFLFGELLRMLRVFDRVGLAQGSRVAPSSMWPSASLNSVGAPDCLISRLNGWPALSPVNASTTPSRAPPHDSGPGWFAIPYPCRTFINYSPTVSCRTKRLAILPCACRNASRGWHRHIFWLTVYDSGLHRRRWSHRRLHQCATGCERSLPTGGPLAVTVVVLLAFGASAVGWNGVYLAEAARRAPAGLAGGFQIAYALLSLPLAAVGRIAASPENITGSAPPPDVSASDRVIDKLHITSRYQHQRTSLILLCHENHDIMRTSLFVI